MSENWIVQNLERALNVWNEKLAEIWVLITQSPRDFRGGAVWSVMTDIHGSLQAVGYALVVLFFTAGVVRTCGSFAEVRKPEHILRLFVRFALAKAAVTYGMEILLSVLDVVQGIAGTVMKAAGTAAPVQAGIPEELKAAIEGVGFLDQIPLWAVTLIGGLFIWVLSFTMILNVYGRFFRLYMYTAVAPVPLAAFAGEPTQHVGTSFLRSYAAVCMEGAVIVVACVIFSVLAGTPPSADLSLAPAAMVWTYIGEVIFNMLILVGTVKMSDRIVKEMMGL